MLIPKARGEFSEAVFTMMRAPEMGFGHVDTAEIEGADDQHIALWALYELHYGGFEDAAVDLEWNPDVLRARARVEQPFEAMLRARYAAPPRGTDFVRAFFDYVAADDGPSLSSFIQRKANPAPGPRTAQTEVDLPPQRVRPDGVGCPSTADRTEGGTR